MTENSEKTEIIFVYNANSDKISGIKDMFKKILHPSAYECNLCLVTFGNFGIKKQWKAANEASNIERTFLHKDEFLMRFPESDFNEFPAAFRYQKDQLSVFIGMEEMNKVNSIEELEDLIQEKSVSK